MIILYLLLGIMIAVVGAVPLGAVNIAVINASINEDIKKASYIALAAGVGEVLLAFFALHCSIQLSSFFQENPWIQVLFMIVFFLAGIYFIFQRNTKKPHLKLSNSKLLTGFSLALLNPPVIIYWILAISLINKYFLELTIQNSISSLLFFFLGIYIGKISTLYLYGKWGNRMAEKQEGSKAKLYRIIGIALISISIFQSIKFVVE